MNSALRKILLATTTASVATLSSLMAATTAAHAAPPTAQVSPGYEARIAEGRRAAQLATRRPWIVPIRRRRHHHRRAID
jgi:hypothetical protein